MVTKGRDCASEFARVALPRKFCNLDRLLFALERRGLDGIVATLPYNVFYLSGFNGVAHKADEPRPYAVVLSRHAAVSPILVVDFGPNPEHLYSKGAFCIKGIRGAPGITYGENRLLYPMRRTGERGECKWTRISWDEALDEMAERLAGVRQAWGPEAIVGATSGAYFSRRVILALTPRSIGSPKAAA